MQLNLKEKIGFTNIKVFLISFATIGGVIFGLGFNRLCKVENTKASGEIKSRLTAIKTQDYPKYHRNNLFRASLATNQLATPSQNRPYNIPETKSQGRSHRISNPEKSVSRLKDYMTNIEERNNFLKEKVNLLANLLDSKEKELLKLNEDNANLKGTLSKTIETQNKLKAEYDTNLSDLGLKLSKKDSDLNLLNTIKSDLENQVNELNNKLSALSNANSSLQNQLSQLQLDRSALETELNKLKEELAKQTALNATLNKNIAELTEGLNNKDKEKGAAIKELGELIESKKNVESELDKIKSSKTDNENQINKLQARINELNTSYEDVNSSVSQLSNMLSKRGADLDQRQDEVFNLRDSLFKANSSKEKLALTLEEKEKNISDLKTAARAMESQMATLQKDIVFEQARQAKTVEQLSHAASLNNSLKRILKNIYIELEMLRAEKKSRNRVFDKSSRVLSSLNEIESGLR